LVDAPLISKAIMQSDNAAIIRTKSMLGSEA